ncbi:MAG: hypothetical protein U0903_21005 [Planctomycetales bacterium]
MISGITLFLNRKRLELSHLCFFGFAVCAILSTHELAAASIVFAVLATLNGQSWYANRYSLTYSIATRSLVFSRGGRVITVLALFAVGFFSATGRVRAPGGPALGFGLDPDLATTVASYQTLLQDSCGDRGFNFNPNQGDVLIWCNKKPFIDQRLSLYVGTGPSDLVKLHDSIRGALRPSAQSQRSRQPAPTSVPWEDLFKKYQISFAVPRLTGSNPDYRTFIALANNPARWQLQRIGASTALFCYGSFQDQKFLTFLRSHQQDFVSEAFRKNTTTSVAHVAWPQPPNVYQKYLWKLDRTYSSGALEGQHLMRLATALPAVYPALPYLAIRKAQQALANNGNDELAYIVLGEGYTYLGRFDTYRQSRPQGSNIEQMRYLQAVAAFNHALTINPNNAQVHLNLFSLYQNGMKVDLAERELSAFRTIALRDTAVQDEQFRKYMQENDALLAKLRQQIEHAEKDAAALAKKNAPIPQQAFSLAQHGCVLKAVELLKEDTRSVNSNPELMKIYGFWLLESGQTEQAYELSGQLQVMSEQSGYQDWRGLRTVCLLINGEYDRAIQIWTDLAQQVNRTGVNGVLATLNPKYNTEAVATWPLTQISASLNYFYLIRDQICALDLNVALASLEKGESESAGKLFAGILEKNPETADRGTIATYLTLITNKPIDPFPPPNASPSSSPPNPKPPRNSPRLPHDSCRVRYADLHFKSAWVAGQLHAEALKQCLRVFVGCVSCLTDFRLMGATAESAQRFSVPSLDIFNASSKLWNVSGTSFNSTPTPGATAEAYSLRQCLSPPHLLSPAGLIPLPVAEPFQDSEPGMFHVEHSASHPTCHAPGTFHVKHFVNDGVQPHCLAPCANN